MNEVPPDGEQDRAVTFSMSSEGLVVYSSAMVTNRGTALMVLNTMYNEVLSTPEECFDCIDLAYCLNRKVPDRFPSLSEKASAKPTIQSTPFLTGLFHRLLGKKND